MSSKITVTYLPESTPSGLVFAPKIPVWISNKKLSSNLFHALIDSGADVNLFPARLAVLVNVDVESGKQITVYGIGGHKMIAHRHKVNLHLAKMSYETEVYFSKNQDVPLLGRQGFFDLFKKVGFSEKKRTVTLDM